MKTSNKKFLLFSFFSLFFLLLYSNIGQNSALAIEVEIPGLGQNPSLPQYIAHIFNSIMRGATTLAVLAIVFGGVYYLVSLGMGKMTSEGKEWIKAGIFGLILLLSSWLIMYTINPNLVSLKLDPLSKIPMLNINIPEPPAKKIPTITYNEIPIGTLTENLLTRTVDCYDFDENGDPIDDDPNTPIWEPTLMNHDRVDCILKLSEAVEKKAENFKKLSEQLAILMEKCNCKTPSSTIGFEPKTNKVLLASANDPEFPTNPYTRPEGELYNVTGITATSAQLRGKIINDGGGSCWVLFKWKKTTDFQWQEGQWSGSFYTNNYFNKTIDNLQPGTNYEFTVEIKNAGQSSGNLPSKTFKTLFSANPSAELLDAANITAASANISGKVTDWGGSSCQYQFKWRKVGDSQWRLAPSSFTGSLGTGETFRQYVSGLEPNTNYEFTAEVKNITGSTGNLSSKQFKTKSVANPSAELLDATEITAASANINGKITDSGGDACQYQFKWRKVGDSQWRLAPSSFTGSLGTGETFRQYVSGLEPNTNYEFTAEVKNITGSTGELTKKTFRTRSAEDPTGETKDAQYITATSAQLRGKIIDDGGSGCYFKFKWRKTTDSQWTLGGSIGGSFQTGQEISQNITNFIPNTNYEFTVEIINQAGKTSGNLPSKTFKTLSITNPSAELFNASADITYANLSGKVTGDGGSICQYQFKWRKVGDSQWRLAPSSFTGSLRAGGIFSQRVSGLEPNTNYEFTAEVKNITGSTGELTKKTFTTLSITGLGCEVYGAGNITATSANLSGKVTGDGGSICQYQFKWRKTTDSQWTLGGWFGSLRTGNNFNQRISGLDPSTIYKYGAEIKNNEETVSCIFKELGPPLGLNAVAINTTQVFVSWVRGYGAENTIVRRKQNSCPTSPTDGQMVYSGLGESFIDTGLTPNTIYCYVAWSTISTIYSDPSNPAYVTTEKDSSCLTVQCPNCNKRSAQRTPCPTTNPCPKNCLPCKCPPGSPDCVPCPPNIKNLIEKGPIILNTYGTTNKEYKGLDEFRTEYPNTSDKDLVDNVIEEEKIIKGKKIKVIKIDIWNKLRLIDKIRYLKEKIKKISFTEDLNNLKNGKKAMSQCYYIQPYVSLLKKIESTPKKDYQINIAKKFKDPLTQENINISKYCKGYEYSNSDFFHLCQNMCPLIDEKNLGCINNCSVCDDNNADCLKNQDNCMKICLNNSKCVNNKFKNFQSCLTSFQNECLMYCGKKYSQHCNDFQDCQNKCQNNSKSLLNNVGRCFFNFNEIRNCAKEHNNFENFKICAQNIIGCVYCSEQFPGDEECLKKPLQNNEEYSSRYLYENQIRQKCPQCFSVKEWRILPLFLIPIRVTISKGIEHYPECVKCPSCSPCFKCPCLNADCTENNGKFINIDILTCTNKCAEFAYDDDPLTFYCRQDWWNEEEEKSQEPLGKIIVCPQNNDIPIGQTVDEAEKWAEKLIEIINKFIAKSDSMIQYIKEIGKEKDYCRCNSICKPGEPACSIECEYKTTRMEYIDPETGEIKHYYVCYCVQRSCDGNPCQKMINMLLGKTASAKCPEGIEYLGVPWHHTQIKNALEELKNFGIIEERSEILKRLSYSRKKMDECSLVFAVHQNDEKIKLLNCERLEDEAISPENKINLTTIIGGKIINNHCYGKLISLIFKKDSLLDDWFCCERREK